MNDWVMNDLHLVLLFIMLQWQEFPLAEFTSFSHNLFLCLVVLSASIFIGETSSND